MFLAVSCPIQVDIKCVKPGRGRNVYVDHLPPLGECKLQ